jgi:hypothetical protein
MAALLLGALALVVLMSALGMFSRAQVSTFKKFGLWVAGIFGLLIAIGLFFTGRLGSAIALLVMLGPLIWSFRLESSRGRARPRAGNARFGARWGAGTPGQGTPRGGMSREEAYQVLGLDPGAGREAIQGAYVRLMRAAHPDRGGSDWLAARINQARDVLLG